MPTARTWFRWLEADLTDTTSPQEVDEQGEAMAFPSIRQQYARALELSDLAFEDKIVAIADALKGADSMAAVTAGKLRIETMKWLRGKQRPKKYGERIEIESNALHVHVAAAEPVSLAPLAGEQRTQLLDIAHKLLRSGKKEE